MKSTRFAFVALAATLAVASFARAQQATAEPKLPDYTKAPYVFMANEAGRAFSDPSFSGLIAIYDEYDANDRHRLLNRVGVFTNAEGVEIYLDWLQFGPPGADTFTVRGYKKVDGKWVFNLKKELSFQKS